MRTIIIAAIVAVLLSSQQRISGAVRRDEVPTFSGNLEELQNRQPWNPNRNPYDNSTWSALALLASFGLVGVRLLRAPSGALSEEGPDEGIQVGTALSSGSSCRGEGRSLFLSVLVLPAQKHKPA